MDIKDIFLKEYIAKEIFFRPPSKLLYWILLLRFHPQNYSLKNTEIGGKVDEIVGGNSKPGVNQFIKEIVRKIHDRFRDELAEDGITEEDLGNKKRTQQDSKSCRQKHPWLVAYKWLWDKKFPRWHSVYMWEIWKKETTNNSEWIQFEEFFPPKFQKIQNDERIFVPTINNYLPIDTKLNLKLNLNYQSSYLLLFHRGVYAKGETTQYLIIPSQAFAPSYQLVDSINCIPQEGAMCKYIHFELLGKEEFIGILVDRALDLPWLSPDSANPVLKWKGEHLEKLWKELQSQNNWQAFYREFEVISKIDSFVGIAE